MKLMILIGSLLFTLGLCAGSFVNAVVWRIHQQTKKNHKDKTLSILSGHSMCPECRHQLAAKDLVPVFSWLALRGRCRYCQKPISWHYPLVEISAGLVFTVSYTFWPLPLDETGSLILFISWLISSVGLLALLVYDFKWMLLPNRILYPTLLAAFGGRIGYILFFSGDVVHDLWLLVLSLTVASGIFWLIFVISSGKWIGYGDVRLGLVTGTLLGSPSKSLLMIFLASVIGLLYTLPSLAAGRQKMAGRVPFGPFLIAATFMVVLFGQAVIDWYTNQLN